MLLTRLFRQILAHGCMVCFTSNRPARDLYKGGLSRKYFEPFIQLIDDRLLQLKVAGGRDYRAQHAVQQAMQQQPGDVKHHSHQQHTSSSMNQSLAAVAAANTGAWLVGPGAEQQLQQHWQQLADKLAELHTAAGAAADTVSGPASVPLPFGRKLWVPQALLSPPGAAAAAAEGSVTADSAALQQQQQQPPQQQHIEAALFTFEQLCGNGGSRKSLEHAGALSANDYLALVRACSVLFVSGLPQLQPQQRDEARRLVTFVDVA
jgi:predicted ATPase